MDFSSWAVFGDSDHGSAEMGNGLFSLVRPKQTENIIGRLPRADPLDVSIDENGVAITMISPPARDQMIGCETVATTANGVRMVFFVAAIKQDIIIQGRTAQVVRCPSIFVVAYDPRVFLRKNNNTGGAHHLCFHQNKARRVASEIGILAVTVLWLYRDRSVMFRIRTRHMSGKRLESGTHMDVFLFKIRPEQTVRLQRGIVPLTTNIVKAGLTAAGVVKPAPDGAEIAMVGIDVHSLGQTVLMKICLAYSTSCLLLDRAQHGHHYAHQQGNNGNDHQQFD